MCCTNVMKAIKVLILNNLMEAKKFDEKISNFSFGTNLGDCSGEGSWLFHDPLRLMLLSKLAMFCSMSFSICWSALSDQSEPSSPMNDTSKETVACNMKRRNGENRNFYRRNIFMILFFEIRIFTGSGRWDWSSNESDIESFFSWTSDCNMRQ